MAFSGPTPLPSSADALAKGFLAAIDSDTWEALWRADARLAEAALGQLAKEAALAGRIDIVMWLAEKLGGLDKLIALAPQLLEALLDAGALDIVGELVERAPFGRRRRPTKSKPARWEVDLVAAAIALNALACLSEAIALDALDASFFAQAELEGARSLMFEARSAAAVDFLASLGVSASRRDEAGRSALAAALERESGSGIESPGLGAARRMAELADYDQELSADLMAGALDKPEILEAGLQAGASPLAMLPGHKGALRAAVERGLDRSAVLLANAGADPFAPDRDGLSALDAAGRARKPGLARALALSAAERLARPHMGASPRGAKGTTRQAWITRS